MSKKSTNKKIKNATPVNCDGIHFKSRLEKYCYKKLKENKIKAEYEKHTYTLVEGFEFDGKKIRPMTYTPDFVGKNFVIECKGQQNDAFPLRWKLFKLYLHNKKKNVKLYLPRNLKQVDEVIEMIKNECVKKKMEGYKSYPVK